MERGGKLTALLLKGDGGQKPMAGEGGADLGGERETFAGDNGALRMLQKLRLRPGYALSGAPQK